MYLVLLVVEFAAAVVFLGATGTIVYKVATGHTCCFGPDPTARLTIAAVAAVLIASISAVLSLVVQ